MLHSRTRYVMRSVFLVETLEKIRNQDNPKAILKKI